MNICKHKRQLEFFIFLCFIRSAFAVDTYQTVDVVSHNLGTYRESFDRRLGGNPEALIKERNLALGHYLRELAEANTDFIFFQEAYGPNKEIESREGSIKSLIKELLLDKYELVEELPKQMPKPGSAIILFRKDKYKILENFSLPGKNQTIALVLSANNQPFLLASAHIAGFSVDKTDQGQKGEKELEDLLYVLSTPGYYSQSNIDHFKNAITIVGIDLNAPPYGTKYVKYDEEKSTIKSKRTRRIKKEKYSFSCSLKPKKKASETAINLVFKKKVARLDYVIGKWSSGKIRLEEDIEGQKKLVRYNLVNLPCSELSEITDPEDPNLWMVPFSDHLPVRVKVSW